MKAVGYKKSLPIEAADALIDFEAAKPEPKGRDIRVAVKAISANPVDYKVRKRAAPPEGEIKILGFDAAGIVDAVGPDVTLFKPGDEVFGMLPYPFGVGAHAEYAVGPARAFAFKPASIDHVTAGALPLAALTAWQALNDTAHLQAGQRVLIHAAAGGVGHLAVQIAKASGAYVIGTASERNHDLVRSLGADEVIDYTATDFTAAASDIDVVLDPIAGDYSARSLRVLRKGGILVSLLPFAPDIPDEAASLGVRAEVMLVEYDHQGMTVIADLVTRGKLRPVIAATFPLADAAKAHVRGETGHVAGKIVLTMP